MRKRAPEHRGYGPSEGAEGESLLDQDSFTLLYAEALHRALPDRQVDVLAPLRLRVSTGGEGYFAAYLDNAYDSYRQAPDDLAGVVGRYVASALDAFAEGGSLSLDPERIVPIVKDRGWLDHVRRSSDGPPSLVYDELNEDLVIVYATDSRSSLSFFGAEALSRAEVPRASLLALACANLTRILPPIERVGEDGTYMLTAGGTFEASLLTLPEVWDVQDPDVAGELVVAIPSRDVLVLTGSDDIEGVAAIRALAERVYRESSYRITQRLFVRRAGAFERYAPEHPRVLH